MLLGCTEGVVVVVAKRAIPVIVSLGIVTVVDVLFSVLVMFFTQFFVYLFQLIILQHYFVELDLRSL